MSVCVCANFVLVLVRATISANPQCEAYNMYIYTYILTTTLLLLLFRTYQRAFYYTLAEGDINFFKKFAEPTGRGEISLKFLEIRVKSNWLLYLAAYSLLANTQWRNMMKKI